VELQRVVNGGEPSGNDRKLDAGSLQSDDSR